LAGPARATRTGIVKAEDLRAAYERDGMIACLDILSGDEAEQARAVLERFIAGHGEDPRYGDWTYFKSHLVLKWLAELARHPVLLDQVEALIGPDILLWNAFIPAKPPRSQGHFGWHQDATYWPIEPINHVVTFWLALSEVTAENGGMRMIPASHRHGQLPHERTGDGTSMLRRGQRVTGEIDQIKAIETLLRPGQASVHHPLTLHGSGANTSGSWRLGVGFNFVAGDVVPKKGHCDSALLLRGSNEDSGFAPETPPDADLSPAALTGHRAARKRGASRYADT
jgi:hypothetical protein